LAAKEKAEGQKKRRIVNVMQAIERTPPLASVAKMVTAASAKAEAAKLATTMSGIDKLISDMVAEETVVAAEESMVAVPDKGKKVVDTSSGEKDFELRHLGGQELSEADKEELKEYGISCGYQPGSLSKSVGFLKLESDISGYRLQHIVDSLFYSNFKVKSLSRFLLSL
jgi:D-serine deaminase-like pyridoxal phosphate-dependent protein